MRIIAGKYKAKKLSFSTDKKIRPTADIVKQAMFTTLFNKVENSVFLDLFCGSGQVGIEALSRGADKVFFVDNNYDAINITKKNFPNTIEISKDSAFTKEELTELNSYIWKFKKENGLSLKDELSSLSIPPIFEAISNDLISAHHLKELKYSKDLQAKK